MTDVQAIGLTIVGVVMAICLVEGITHNMAQNAYWKEQDRRKAAGCRRDEWGVYVKDKDVL